ncbi:GNAT family N-acetyltransferase [Pseudomonas syringae]|uniref:GNAT family N-acetyltransferase n=1 Tax=Pseudomonas syringae TaxID=317 RepID=UPI0006286F67|nr:GNAT family N-acetyltransferase [Pseudomonas syringae]RML67910.1 hypothetical protein ALQ91_200004 [Pseudomonas syringae pv. syringae]
MAAIANPHIGFVSYQAALRDGIIKPLRCYSHPDLYMMQDHPATGVLRITYAFHSGKVAKAYAVYIQADPIEGKPCFGVGYATAENYRNRGLATEILKASMEELRQGLSRHMPEPGFYVEAIVGVENQASQRVAARTLCDAPDAIEDSESGLPALHYIKLVG